MIAGVMRASGGLPTQAADLLNQSLATLVPLG